MNETSSLTYLLYGLGAGVALGMFLARLLDWMTERKR